MKKIFGLGFALLLSICLVTGCGCTKKEKTEDNKNIPHESTNKNVIKDQNLEEFKFEKTSLKYDNGNSTLEVKVTNTSDKTAKLQYFNIIVMNEDKIIVTLRGTVGATLEPSESRIISSTYGDDITNATSIKYEVIR